MSNLLKRILAAIVLLIPLLTLIFTGYSKILAIIGVILAGLGGYEFATISLGKKHPYMRGLCTILSSILCASICLVTKNNLLPIIVLIMIVPICFFAVMIKIQNANNSFIVASTTSVATLYSGGLFGILSLIPLITENGNFWLFLLLAAVIINDTMAYTTGKLFGKRKLNKILSPNKTWEGSFGGLIGSIISCAVISHYLLSDLTIFIAILLGLILGIIAQIGDLMESFVKRSFNVKDTSNLIPGHGGILDRCDALLLGAPVVLLFQIF